jgi:mono/diheme cytochrome c family protein
MTSVRRKALWIPGMLVLIAALALGALYFLRRPQLTPALRGLALAQELGCFACHGPGATGGVANPGSEDGPIPAWDGGNAMMYVENEQEIREWILYGRPKRLQADTSTAGTDGRRSAGTLPVNMPAYEGVVSSGELEDLVAYYKAVAFYDKPPPPAREGYRVAARMGCFGCHGPGGLVGASNPRSFKGYIPPWRGGDYAELVKNGDELRSWIRDGEIERLAGNPIARWFTDRQVIQMPAYGDTLTDEELEALVNYIEWLNQ